MVIDYTWKGYHDREVREQPSNEWEEKLAEEQADQIVQRFVEELSPRFKKRVLGKLSKHFTFEDRQEEKGHDSLVSDRARGDSLV